jgi:hypothetical protein
MARKSSRFERRFKTTYSDRPFGVGLGERCPVYRMPCRVEDDQWWAESYRRDEDARIEFMAAEAEAYDRMTAGLLF